MNFDLAHLSVFSTTDVKKEEATKEALQESARDAFVQFFSQLSELVKETDTGKTRLPKTEIRLPREKPLPAEKPKTRWEEFAERKNIQKDKERSKKVYDEVTGEYERRYGYKRINDPNDEWLIVVPNTDRAEDPFLKRMENKKERVKEQKKREERNRKRAARAIAEQQVVSTSIKGGNKKKDQIAQALKAASHPTSSASMNQFNKVKNKVGIFEEGSSIPKIFDRNKGQKPKKGKR